MLDTTPSIISADLISPAILAVLPDDLVRVRVQPEMQTTPNPTAETLEAFLAEAVAFVNQARKILPQPPGEKALHSGERDILRILDQAGPRTVPQIARARSTSRQNVQIIINRLSAEGRVELLGNPSHERSKLVALTSQGKNWLEAYNKAPGLTLPPTLAIPETEIRAAGQVLLRLRQALAAASEPV